MNQERRLALFFLARVRKYAHVRIDAPTKQNTMNAYPTGVCIILRERGFIFQEAIRWTRVQCM